MENAADTFENADIEISEFASLCTNQIPCYLLASKRYQATFPLAQLVLTDVTNLNILHWKVKGDVKEIVFYALVRANVIQLQPEIGQFQVWLSAKNKHKMDKMSGGKYVNK